MTRRFAWVLGACLIGGCHEEAPKEPPATLELREEKPHNLIVPMASKGAEGKFGKTDAPAPAEPQAKAAAPRAEPSKREKDRTIAQNAGLLRTLRGTEMGDAGGAGGLGTRGSGASGGENTLGIGGLGTRGVGAGGGGNASGIGELGTSGYGHGSGKAQRRDKPKSVFGAGGLGSSMPITDAFDGPSDNAENFGPRPELPVNKPTSTKEDRLSTFAIDVDTAAYSIARRTLMNGALPEPTLVRVEELINYFHYDYDSAASAEKPLSIDVDGAISPVDESKRILRVGVQARAIRDADRLPANLVFLVDTSCSMTDEDKLGLAKKSLLIALDHLTAKDSVAITTYAGGVKLVLPPTPAREKAKITAAIEGLASGGGTAMESGLTLAYQQAARMLKDGTITRIIVCSDGDANIGATSHDQMLAKVKSYVSEGVRISTIGYGAGNYKDENMEQIADKGNGNYFYVDSLRMAERVFGRDLTKMIQDVAEDVKIQVEMNPELVESYRLVGYENRDVADKDFRNDRVDAGEIGAGHQVTALYELSLTAAAANAEGGAKTLATVRVRAKAPRQMKASEMEKSVTLERVQRAFAAAGSDFRFATAVMGAAELFRHSPHANAWTWDRVLAIASDESAGDADRAEFFALVKNAKALDQAANRVARRR